jgi:hypothetical protein
LRGHGQHFLQLTASPSPPRITPLLYISEFSVSRCCRAQGKRPREKQKKFCVNNVYFLFLLLLLLLIIIIPQSLGEPILSVIPVLMWGFKGGPNNPEGAPPNCTSPALLSEPCSWLFCWNRSVFCFGRTCIVFLQNKRGKFKNAGSRWWQKDWRRGLG